MNTQPIISYIYIEINGKNIDLGETDINLTYRKVKHALRDNKNPNQKVTESQLKRLGGAIKENEVYFIEFSNTEKNISNTENVEDMAYMFKKCKILDVF